jgi:hypothetical protein
LPGQALRFKQMCHWRFISLSVSISFLNFPNPKHTDDLLMVGITAGFALWTKNEEASLVLSVSKN